MLEQVLTHVNGSGDRVAQSGPPHYTLRPTACIHHIFFRAVVWSTKGATMLGLQRVHVTLASRRVVVPHTPLNDEEDSRLQAFDLETAYGPSLGLSRKERWLRAEGAWPAAGNPLSIRRACVS